MNEDGTLNEEAAPFKDAKAGDEFEISVKATGYANDFSFTYVAPNIPMSTHLFLTLSIMRMKMYRMRDLQHLPM